MKFRILFLLLSVISLGALGQAQRLKVAGSIQADTLNTQQLILNKEDSAKVLLSNGRPIALGAGFQLNQGELTLGALNSSQVSRTTYLGVDTTALLNNINSKAPINNPSFTGTVSGIDKSMIGLGNVNNTSDASRALSTAEQQQLGSKLKLSDTLIFDNYFKNYNAPAGSSTQFLAGDKTWKSGYLAMPDTSGKVLVSKGTNNNADWGYGTPISVFTFSGSNTANGAFTVNNISTVINGLNLTVSNNAISSTSWTVNATYKVVLSVRMNNDGNSNTFYGFMSFATPTSVLTKLNNFGDGAVTSILRQSALIDLPSTVYLSSSETGYFIPKGASRTLYLNGYFNQNSVLNFNNNYNGVVSIRRIK